MRYTAILLTISSVALAAPMESGATIAMRQQAGGILSGLTSLLGNPGSPLPGNGDQHAPNNGSTGGILSGLTSLLGNPGRQLPGIGNQNAPNNGGTGGILSGLTSLFGNLGSGVQSAPNNSSTGGIMSGITSLLGNLGSHLPGNGDQYPPNNGGTGGIMADLQVLPDHMKFTMNPISAGQPIPKEQNSQMREGHRLAHVAINKSIGVGDGDIKNNTASQF
ncbi:hypothetical protein MY11210_004582 [Beauveria gryllotalpidicola]